jgi:hypothetical protein
MDTPLQEILTDPGHPDHAETLRFLRLPPADAFDAAQFDLDAVNAALASQGRVTSAASLCTRQDDARSWRTLRVPRSASA